MQGYSGYFLSGSFLNSGHPDSDEKSGHGQAQGPALILTTLGLNLGRHGGNEI